MKRLVLNIFAGDTCKAEHAITGPNHKAFADRIGAEYRFVVRKKAPSYGPAIKFLASEAAADADQTLFLDTDVVITERCPNIFDEVPQGYWGVVDESGRVAHDPQWNIRMQREADNICHSLKWPRLPLIRRINSGVMVMPRNARDLYWPPAKPVPETWCFEQLFLSMQLQMANAPLVELDWRYNWCYSQHDFEAFSDRAFILHLAGAKKPRIDLLKLLISSHNPTMGTKS